jgi:hypothetical protein
VNRHRLKTCLDALDRAAPDAAGECSVYVKITSEKNVILRAEDPRTGQRVVCHMMTYEETPELERNMWEKSFLPEKRARRPIRQIR